MINLQWRKYVMYFHYIIVVLLASLVIDSIWLLVFITSSQYYYMTEDIGAPAWVVIIVAQCAFIVLKLCYGLLLWKHMMEYQISSDSDSTQKLESDRSNRNTHLHEHEPSLTETPLQSQYI